MTIVTSFIDDRRGGTAILFGLLMLPLMAAVGAALDYTRAASARTAAQAAVDAAALLAARDFASLSNPQLVERTRQVFRANFNKSEVVIEPVEVDRGDKSIRVRARGSIKTSIMGIFNIDRIDFSTASEAAWGQNRIELALVLDNTGSMATSNKMPALKTAVRDLLDVLERASPERDAIRISIVPFDTQVNIGTDFRNANWLDFDAGLDRNLRTSRSNWRGCVVDRDMPYDTSDASPTLAGSRYPAAACTTGSLAQLQPLTSNFRDLRATVGSMQPSGNTNITIGVAWGLASLSASAPLDQAAPSGAGRVSKIMIVLTDGDNTRNRFTSDARDIDARTRKACGEVKSAGIRVHTIRVIEGNARLLRDCATSATETYHEVRNASELGPLFRRLANEITGIRLTH
jgi:Flp pilus assembly protein TadG